jgi:hypothetical protein
LRHQITPSPDPFFLGTPYRNASGHPAGPLLPSGFSGG